MLIQIKPQCTEGKIETIQAEETKKIIPYDQNVKVNPPTNHN